MLLASSRQWCHSFLQLGVRPGVAGFELVVYHSFLQLHGCLGPCITVGLGLVLLGTLLQLGLVAGFYIGGGGVSFL